MKFIYIILFFVTHSSFAQADNIKIILNDSTTLELERVKFDPRLHKLEYFENSLIAIDGNPFFGSDGSVPQYKLRKALLTINKVQYLLDTDGMYEPWFGNATLKDKFIIINNVYKYILGGTFSDGAGFYYAEWLIAGKSSIRTLITDNEALLECMGN